MAWFHYHLSFDNYMLSYGYQYRLSQQDSALLTTATIKGTACRTNPIAGVSFELSAFPTRSVEFSFWIFRTRQREIGANIRRRKHMA
jgi:hypothetical protein